MSSGCVSAAPGKSTRLYRPSGSRRKPRRQAPVLAVTYAPVICRRLLIATESPAKSPSAMSKAVYRPLSSTKTGSAWVGTPVAAAARSFTARSEAPRSAAALRPGPTATASTATASPDVATATSMPRGRFQRIFTVSIRAGNHSRMADSCALWQAPPARTRLHLSTRDRPADAASSRRAGAAAPAPQRPPRPLPDAGAVLALRLGTVRATTSGAQAAEDNEIAVLYAIACDDAEWTLGPADHARAVAADRLRYPITAGMPPNIWPCAFWPKAPVEPPVTIT